MRDQTRDKGDAELRAVLKIVKLLKPLSPPAREHVLNIIDTNSAELDVLAKLRKTVSTLNENARARVLTYIKDHLDDASANGPA